MYSRQRLALSPPAIPRTTRGQTPFYSSSHQEGLLLCTARSLHFPATLAAHVPPEPPGGSTAPNEVSRRAPTLSRPTHDEIETLLSPFTSKTPSPRVAEALKTIYAICSELDISQDQVVIDWFKTATGLVKGDTRGRWAYDFWDRPQKTRFGRSLQSITRDVQRAARTGAQAVVDILVRRDSGQLPRTRSNTSLAR